VHEHWQVLEGVVPLYGMLFSRGRLMLQAEAAWWWQWSLQPILEGGYWRKNEARPPHSLWLHKRSESL